MYKNLPECLEGSKDRLLFLLSNAAPPGQKDASEDPDHLEHGDHSVLARYLERKHMQGVVYAEGAFWRYENTHWKAIPAHELSRLVQKLSGLTYGENRAKVFISKNSAASILGFLADNLAQPDFFECPARGINAANCFISFEDDGTPVAKEHSPEHRQRHTLSAAWNGQILKEPPKGSLLARLLTGTFLDDPLADEKYWFLQQLMFVAASGMGTRLVRPKAVIFFGEKAENGKNQILDMAEGLLPPQAVSHIAPQYFADDNKLLTLRGAALNTAGELSASAITGEKFKEIVTGDPNSGRFAHSPEVIHFRSQALHLFGTNKLPPFKGGFDPGIRRRLAVLEFLRVIPMEERVERIGSRIATEEADLLLAWALGAAEHILTKRAYEEPQCSKALVAEWTQTDPALAWFEDQRLPPENATPVDGEKPPKIRISSADTYRHFCMWSWAEEGESPSLGQKAFVDRIKPMLVHGERYIPGSNGFRGFEGMCLKEPSELMKSSPYHRWPEGSVGGMGQDRSRHH
jgi:phage/plasmid-associated DNA primase